MRWSCASTHWLVRRVELLILFSITGVDPTYPADDVQPPSAAGPAGDIGTGADEPGDAAPGLMGRRFRIEVRMVTLDDRTLDDARKHAEATLRRNIRIVDRFCMLTDVQKQKLELVGRGDIKRLMDSGSGNELLDEIQFARRGFARRFPAAPASSLFVKSLERLLTAEQATRYVPLRAVFRAGGAINRRTEAEIAEIDLSGTKFSDGDLADLARWPASPALAVLNLAGTPVTSAGLGHLQHLRQLKQLDLSDTAISDAGLNDLRDVKTLRHLVVKGLNNRLGDAAVADLKRALPQLEIHW